VVQLVAFDTERIQALCSAPNLRRGVIDDMAGHDLVHGEVEPVTILGVVVVEQGERVVRRDQLTDAVIVVRVVESRGVWKQPRQSGESFLRSRLRMPQPRQRAVDRRAHDERRELLYVQVVSECVVHRIAHSSGERMDYGESAPTPVGKLEHENVFAGLGKAS
jgi:hypothetical protein